MTTTQLLSLILWATPVALWVCGMYIMFKYLMWRPAHFAPTHRGFFWRVYRSFFGYVLAPVIIPVFILILGFWEAFQNSKNSRGL